MKTVNLAIMFTDIVGYTERTAGQSREENEKLINTHDRLLIPTVNAYSGTHVKSIGDALLCVFPSPTNALLAAMAMQDTLYSYNLEVEEEQQIHIRVGVNLGEVRLAKGDVFGDAVNLASRVQSLCPPDEIYFSDAVYLAMNKAEVPAKELGAHELKGAAEPVRIWCVPRFASTKLVAESMQTNTDIAEIAYPYGGAHLKIPVLSLGLTELIRRWGRPLAALTLIVLTLVVFYPAGNYLQSKTVTSYRKQYATSATRIEALRTLEQQITNRLAKDRQKLADAKANSSLDSNARRAITNELKILIDENQELLELLRAEVFDQPDYKSLVEAAGNPSIQGDEKLAWKTSLGIEEFEKRADLIRKIFAERINIERTQDKIVDAGSFKARRSPIFGMASKIEGEAKRDLRNRDFTQSLEKYTKASEMFEEAYSREQSIQKMMQQGGSDLSFYHKEAASAKTPLDSIIANSAAVRLDPSDSDSTGALVDAYDKAGKDEEAAFFLEKNASRQFPYTANLKLGRLKAKRKEYKEAAKAFETAERKAKNDEQRRRAEEFKHKALSRSGGG